MVANRLAVYPPPSRVFYNHHTYHSKVNSDLLHSWFRHASLTSRDKVSLMTINELDPPWTATTVQGGSYCPERLLLSWTATTVQDSRPKLRMLVKLFWVKNHK
jgi:hypothetical protein